MMPAMLLSWLFGALLLHSLGFSVFTELWIQVKIIAVLLLTYYHFTLGKYLNDFDQTIIRNLLNFLEYTTKYQQLY